MRPLPARAASQERGPEVSQMTERWHTILGYLLAALVATACAAQAGDGSRGANQGGAPAIRKTSAVLAVSAVIPALSWAYAGTSSGGAYSFAELYMQGLVTSGVTSSAPEPRIAVELPSLDRGSAQVAADGVLRATWKLRPEVHWADGTDLTGKDYAFGL